MNGQPKEPWQHKSNYGYLWIYALPVLLLLFSIGLASKTKEQNELYLQKLYINTQDQLIRHIQDTFSRYEQGLLSLSEVAFNIEDMPQEKWASYFARLDIENTLPALKSVSYAHNFKKDIQQIYGQDPPGFLIWQQGLDDDINLKVFSLEKEARENVVDPDQSNYFVMITIPHLRKDEAGRKLQIADFVYSFIDMPLILEQAIGHGDYHMNVQIFPNVMSSDHKKVFELSPGSEQGASKSKEVAPATRYLKIMDQHWGIVFTPMRSFDKNIKKYEALLVLISGFILAGMCYLGLWQLVKARRKLETLNYRNVSDLQEQRKLTEMVINNIPDWVYVRDEDFNTIIANKAYLEMGAFHEEAEGLKVNSPAYQEKFKSDLIALDEGYHRDYEELELDPETTIHMDITKVRFYGSEGKKYVLTIARNVSELQNAKARLEEEILYKTEKYRQQSQFLNAILENLPAGVYVKDLKDDNRWILVNRYLANLFGWKREEILGKTNEEFFTEREAKFLSGLDQKALEGGTPMEIEKQLLGKDGMIDTYTIKVPLFDDDGTPNIILGIMTDVTEKKKSEDKLRLFKSVVKYSTDGVLITDSNLKKPGPNVIYANDSITKITGWKPDDLIGKSPRLFQGKETNRKEIQKLKKALRQGKPWVGELLNYHKEGTPYWLAISIFPIKDKYGNITHYGAIERDITDKIEIRESLQKAREEADFANQSKDSFLANMSHELRTPLNSIIGLVRILSKEKDVSSEHKKTLNVVLKSSSALLDIVNDILDLSKIEAGKVSLEARPFNVVGLMYSLIEQMNPLASDKGLTLKSNHKKQPETWVNGDELRVSRIIINLISNAIKYTPKGHVDVKLGVKRAADNHIDFSISVTDTGIGISEDKILHIFDKFAQAEESTERKFGGTGLGLNITQQLVNMMGGDITVKSKVGKGSTFTVKIPFKQAKAPTGVDANDTGDFDLNFFKGPKRIPIKKAKILVAEDQEFNKVFIVKLLERVGARDFEVVTDGQQAVKAFQKNSYDLVLMDCHMPNMNGYDATRGIRDFEAEKKSPYPVPIIAMTADAMIGTRQNCLDAGMSEYISKPIDEDKFRALMSTCFELNNVILKERRRSSPQEDDGPAANLSVLRGATDGDKEMEKELVGLFYLKTMEDIQKLKENCTPGKNETWVEAAHGLKGSAGYIGAKKLYDLCNQAQKILKGTKKNRLAQYKSIQKEHDRVCGYLRSEGLLEDRRKNASP